MTRPRLLDMFCGAGGAAMGYHRAGFEVVGVDIMPQKRYPFEFHQADALEFCREHGHEFDAIHASPPCQANSALKAMWNSRNHEDLIPQTREALQATGKLYIIENVPGASTLRPTLMLCGTMFGLRTDCGAELRRHRYFETNWTVGLAPTCDHYADVCIGGYGGHGRDRRRVVSVHGHSGGSSTRLRNRQRTITVAGDGGGMSKLSEDRSGIAGRMFSLADRNAAMGIDWMTGNELSQAIPPAYTEWIGARLMEHLR